MKNQHPLINKFLHYESANHLFGRNNKLIIAVSGGMDSVVLLDISRESPKKGVTVDTPIVVQLDITESSKANPNHATFLKLFLPRKIEYT